MTAAPLPMVCAIGIVIAHMLPSQILGMHYDPMMTTYWVSNGIPVAIVAVLAGILPLPFLVELPDRCRKVILAPKAWQFAAGLFVVVLALTLYVQYVALERFPSTADEIAELFHAKMIANGMLSYPVDPNPEFFAIDNLVDTGRWYSQYPIGGVIALLPGVILGVPWLVNPVLGALSVVGTYLFARKVYGEVQGRSIALVFGQSQNLLFMSATYLNHLPTLACAVVALIGVAEWERADAPGWKYLSLVLIGLALGTMATIRPLDAMAMSAALGLFQLYVIGKDFRRWKELAVQGIAGFIGSVPVFLANRLTTGHPLRFGYDVAWGEAHRIGFHTDPYGMEHDFIRGIVYAARYVSQLSFATLGWPIPLAVIVIIGLVSMRRTSRWDALMISLIGMQLAGYALYWGVGDFFGPRFLFTVIPAVVILVTRSPFLFGEMLGARAARSALVLFLACFVVAWASPHAGSIRGFANQLPQVRRSFRLDYAGAVRRAGVTKGLVFVREATSARLLHRIWGLGVSRELGVRMMSGYDACSVLAGVRAAERDSTATREEKLRTLMQNVVKLPDAPFVLGTRDKGIRFAGMETITDSCKEELDDDKTTLGVYGVALPLNQFDSQGRIAGDVIFVQDLTDHNDVLRKRFSDRPWYRFVVSEDSGFRLSTKVVPYESTER